MVDPEWGADPAAEYRAAFDEWTASGEAALWVHAAAPIQIEPSLES